MCARNSCRLEFGACRRDITVGKCQCQTRPRAQLSRAPAIQQRDAPIIREHGNDAKIASRSPRGAQFTRPSVRRSVLIQMSLLIIIASALAIIHAFYFRGRPPFDSISPLNWTSSSVRSALFFLWSNCFRIVSNCSGVPIVTSSAGQLLLCRTFRVLFRSKARRPFVRFEGSAFDLRTQFRGSARFYAVN